MKPAQVFCAGALALLAACNRAPQPSNASAVAATAQDKLVASIATTRSDYAATVPVGQAIVIDNPYGDVHVRFGGFEHKVDAHAVLQEPKGAAHIDLKPTVAEDGHYTIAPRLPAGASARDGQRIDLSVFVPEGHALSVRTEQGLIDVHGVHGDVDLKSTTGDINLRGIKGAIHGETGGGAIEAALDSAPRNASQRLATTTGDIQVGVDDHLDAALDMATSALFATDYSIEVTRRPGEEPNKRAHAVIGANASKLVLESRRGQIRLIRRAGFTTVGGESSAAPSGQEGGQDNDSD